MDTYFIRHTPGMKVDNATFERLFREHRIAIHFPHNKNGKLPKAGDNSSLNPDNYSGKAKSAMRALNNLASEGGYAFARYRFGRTKESIVGMVKPKSRIQKIKGRWADRPRRTALLKTLRLLKVRHLNPSDAGQLRVSQPRLLTIARWHGVGRLVECLVRGIPLPKTLDSLTDAQQEVLCSEWFRHCSSRHHLPILKHLLMPIGRTREDVDIEGITTDGCKVFAQVTHGSLESSSWKMDCLDPYRKGSGKGENILVMFCKEAGKVAKQNGIHVVPMELVFREFARTPAGKKWITHSIH